MHVYISKSVVLRSRMSFTIALMFLCVACFAQNISSTKIFGNKLLQSITKSDGWSYEFTYNDMGQLIKVAETDKSGVSEDACSFDYTAGIVNGKAFDILMTCQDIGAKCYLRLGTNNFVESCFEVYDDGETDTWSFEYNSDGQLLKMTRSEGDNEVTEMTYADGDIVKVVMTGEEENDVTEFSYTSEDVTQPISNANKIMLYDDFFYIDMDELGNAYFAGLLGNPTRHLPVTRISSDKSNEDLVVETFTWNIDANNNLITVTSYDGPYKDTTTFTWFELATGIASIKTDAVQEKVIYDIKGVQLHQPRKGLNIVDGKKILVK